MVSTGRVELQRSRGKWVDASQNDALDGSVKLMVLTVVDEMCSFFMRHSDKRQVLTACAESLRAGVHCS